MHAAAQSKQNGRFVIRRHSILIQRILVYSTVVGGSYLIILSLLSGSIHPLPRLSQSAGIIVLGIALMLVGIGRSGAATRNLPTPRKYGIRITAPLGEDIEHVTSVSGTIKNALPAGYNLKLFRLYPLGNEMTPLADVQLASGKRHWRVDNCHIGNTGGKCIIAAYMVGPCGNILVDYFRRAVAIHKPAMDLYAKSRKTKPMYLPPLDRKTDDMIECHRVTVTLT